MIFSSLSENLLLTILQRLQELYAETTAGRADSNVASRYVLFVTCVFALAVM